MKTKREHTAGPWEAVAHEDSDSGKARLFVESESGAAVADCDVEGFLDEACANARLIAAAPDLLEAAKASVEKHASMIPSGKCNCPQFTRLRAAIAKAEGR